MKKLITLLFILACVSLNAQEKFVLVTPQMPQFVGGEKALLQYIHGIDFSETTITTEEYIAKAYICFTIDTIGFVQNVYVHKTSGNHIYDSILVDHVKKMPKWIPVEYNTQMILPFQVCF